MHKIKGLQMFHINTNWLPEQRMNPIQSQNGLNDG